MSFRPRASNEDGESRSLPSSSSSSSTPPPAFEEVLRSGPSERSRDQSMAQSRTGSKSASVPAKRHTEGNVTRTWNSHAEAIRWGLDFDMIDYLKKKIEGDQFKRHQSHLWLGVNKMKLLENMSKHPLSVIPKNWFVWQVIKSSG